MADPKVDVEKLDRIYICTACRNAFIFRSDMEEHQRTTGHETIRAFNLERQFS